MKTLVKKIIQLINKIQGNKRLFYYSPNENNSFGRTAVKTKFGFWYVGDVLDQKDIACGILNFGLVEPDETKLVIKIFDYLVKKENVTIFDIGANTGYYGLLAANFFKEKGKVFSFEPVKEYADCIKESIKINALGNTMEVLNIALSNVNGEREIYVSGTCSSLEKDFNKGELSKEKVILKRLDDISMIPMPDFIKIDVEGHELMALEGSKETIKKSKPLIFMEVIERLASHNFVNKNYLTTMNLLLGLGYNVYILKNANLAEFNVHEKIEGVHMYLFIHKEHTTIKELFLK